MRIDRVLHSQLLLHTTVHNTRAVALAAAVNALAHGAFLSVTNLGRRLLSPARPKHNIKRVDRLLSNHHLHRERLSLYQLLCHKLCQHLNQPIILVDWSDIVERQRILLIRAALCIDGRAIPLYEAAFPLAKYNSARTHRDFLLTLKSLLPKHCTPIIVTDAGFRRPWFKAVESLGWFWLGRVRNCINYRTVSRNIWRQTNRLHPRAKSDPQYLGLCELSSKNPYRCHLYLFKKLKQFRKAKRSTYHLARHGSSEVFKRQQREPWILATNLDPQHFDALRVVNLYTKRMGIEAAFRDLKSDRFGFGLSLARTKNIERLNILLLIAALTTLCLWWVGLLAQQRLWYRHFQANTVTQRKVLSIPFLALEVIQRADYCIKLTDLYNAHQLLLEQLRKANEL